MKIGFTGTQHGMTPKQFDMFKSCFPLRDCTQFHHGDCIGADAQAANWVRMRSGTVRIFAYPSVIVKKRAWVPAHVVRHPQQPLPRNQEIVDEIDLLIATPGEQQEIWRSGTWATIRYARKVGKPVWLILPDGVLQKEECHA